MEARTAARSNLKRLLAPKNIAVVGGESAQRVVRLTVEFGFAGPIYVVNAKRDRLAGLPCLKSIADLPEAPDAVFLGVPREATLGAIEALGAQGAGGAVCYASGFSETTDGAELERDLIAKAGNMAVVGPNCHGIINAIDRVALWPDEHGVAHTSEGVAIVTQSGNIGITLTMQSRGLDIAYMLSVGNQAVLRLHDYIDVLADDPRVNAIGLYIEAIEDAQLFADAALKCARRRLPIVAIKAGRSEAAARATLSHTASLAGSDTLVDAFFDRYGIIRVDSLAELVESLKLLSRVGSIAGPRIASLSCSGGDAAMLADFAQPLGLDLAPPPESVQSRLIDILGTRVTVSNPLDYHTYIWGDRERLTACFEAMCGAGYDATVLIHDYPRPNANDVAAWDITTEAMIAAHRAHDGVGIVVSSLPETMPEHARHMLHGAGLAAMQGLPECLKAIAGAVRLDEAWRRLGQRQPPGLLDPLPDAFNRTPVISPEATSKALFRSHGIPVPTGRRVAIQDAAAAAREIGFPVAVKTAAAVAHKTEIGGIVLGLSDVVAAAAAAESMATLGPLVYVERMLAPPLLEMIVGINLDSAFQHYLILGAGGTRVELHKDNRSLLLPTTAEEIRTALEALRIWPILEGYRGEMGVDIDGLIAMILRLANFAIGHRDNVLEIDVNPLMVYPAPDAPIAADVLMCTRAPLDIGEA